MKGNKPENVTTQPYIVSIDMGSSKRGSFGWCDNRDHKGFDIDELLTLILKENYFAMGIEAPLFIPVRPNVLKDFTAKRDFESNHPWSAGAGACVTSINLGFLASLLAQIHEVNPDVALTTDRAEWEKREKNCILIWEAFIAGNSEASTKSSSHLDDAREALRLFEAGNNFPKISGDYLNLPLAIAKAVGMKTLSSGMLVVKGEKGLFIR